MSALHQPVHELRVRSMAWEAEGVVSLVLARVDGGDMPEFEPGAHIDLMMRPDLIRQYSLCSDPSDRSAWRIAVLLEPATRGGSLYVHTVLRPGMIVSALGPRNNFQLTDADHYLFIAGGIGVTPLIPMVKQVAGQGKAWRMLYGGRRRCSMAFVDELTALGPEVTIAPQDDFGLLDLNTAIGEVPTDAAIYCCGPEPLISAVETTCSTLGRREPCVERFAARPATATDAPKSENESFEVVLCRSGRRLNVPADKSIVQVLADAEVFVPTSCTEGYCGVCQTDVVRGIPDHRDEYLSPEVRRTNKQMMVCVGRSKTPELVLDI